MSDVDNYSSDSASFDEPMQDTSDSSFEAPDIQEEEPITRTNGRVPYKIEDTSDDIAIDETESRMESTASVRSNASRLSVSGGKKISKKTKLDPLYLQRLIDKDLRERIPISVFIQEKIVTMIKNTVGIKCKVCGSDNVYVESKQVRSADEAMTKFYTCLNCGNKWRFD